MIKNIPAKKVVYCDICKAECIIGKNYLHEGKLTLTRACFDYQNMPVADATVCLDLCDTCNDTMANFINEKQK